MSDNDNTPGLLIKGGTSSTRATSRNNKKPKARSISKDVVKITEKNEDISETQQAPPPSNRSRKNVEKKKKKDSPKKASTSTMKRRKTSSEKSEACTSSDGVGKNEVGKTKVTADENRVKGKPKPKSKYNKKEVNKKSKHKQGEATPSYQPRQFIGLYIYKEHDGTKTLGTVRSYDPKTKLFKIGYDDDSTEYMEQDEVLKRKASGKDIFEARQALLQSNASEETTDEEEQKDTLSEEE